MAIYESLSELMRDRAKWLTVRVDQNDDGTFDVVLTIDGSYSSRGDAEAIREMFESEFNELLVKEGIPRA